MEKINGNNNVLRLKYMLNSPKNSKVKLKKNKILLNQISYNSNSVLIQEKFQKNSFRNNLLLDYNKTSSSLSKRKINKKNYDNYNNNSSRNVINKSSNEVKNIFFSRNKINSNSNISFKTNGHRKFEEEKIMKSPDKNKEKKKNQFNKRVLISSNSFSKKCFSLSNLINDNLKLIENPEELHFFNVTLNQKIKKVENHFENIKYDTLKIGEYL